MDRLRTIIGSVFILFFIFLLVYNGDNEYLQEKTADKIWYEFTETVNDLLRKGDHITYDNSVHPLENTKWQKYRNRFAYQVELINTKNAPIMRNSYLLETKFEDFEGKYNVFFTVYEKNTGQIIETKEITSEPIKAKSTIPALLAVAFAIITFSPIISLLVAIWVGSIINNANSPIVGLQQVMANYLPAGLLGKDFSNLKIIISFLLIQASLALLSYSSCTRGVKDSNGRFLKILPLPFMSVHPYIFSAMGSWWMNLLTTRSKKVFRSSFISQSLSLVLPVLLFSPYILYILAIISHQLSVMYINHGPVELFLKTFPFRFFSFSILSILAGYKIFNKDLGIISTEQSPSSSLVNKPKPMMKINKWLIYAAVFICIGTISLGSFYFGDINSALLLGTSACFVTVLLVLVRSYLLSISEAGKVLLSAVKENMNYIVLLILSLALVKVLSDLGTIYYIISLFKIKIGSSIFPVAAFIMSVLTTLLMGNSFITFTFLIPLLLPIAGQIGSNAELMMTIAGILEGGIAGEMLSPFSPTSIITSSAYKISSVKHIIAQLPYVLLGLVSATVLGFLMVGTDISLWVSYCAILTFGFIVMFKKQSIK